MATGSWDNTTIVYDIVNENLCYKITSHSHPVNDVLFVRPSNSSGLCLLTASSDKYIILWGLSALSDSNLRVGGSPPQLRTFIGHEDCVRGLYQSPTSTDLFYSVSNDQFIHCWNINDGNKLQTMCGHLHFIYTIARISDNRFMTSGEDTTIRVWDQV